MKRGMTIEYLKCRADLNFEVDYGVNGAIGAIATNLFYSDNGSFSSIIKKINTLHVPLIKKLKAKLYQIHYKLHPLKNIISGSCS